MLLKRRSDLRHCDDAITEFAIDADTKLGTGGFGAVFAAQVLSHEEHCVPVAVKVLDVQVLSPLDVHAFKRESDHLCRAPAHPGGAWRGHG